MVTTDEGRERFLRISPAAAPALVGFVRSYASDEAQASYDTIDGTGLGLTLVGRPWVNMRLEPSYADASECDNLSARFRRDASAK